MSKAESNTTRVGLPGHEVIVKGVLGRGGMGVVYRVHETGLGRDAALKVKQGSSPQHERRFQREVLVTARLDHPNIPPVYEAGRTSSGEIYMLMRLVEGRELKALLDEADGDPTRRSELLGALIKVGEAMAYAHSRGVVHRDLKPANIMVGRFGEVLVMDWGLARLLQETADEDANLRRDLGPPAAEGLTRDGALVGTIGYMAPEQARGEDVDPRSDVYSLGAMLCLALTGALPVRGQTMEQLRRVSEGAFEIDDWVNTPGELRAITLKALAAEQDDRYPSMEALVADLQAFLEGRPVSVYTYRASEQATRLIRAHPALFSGIAVAFVLGLLAVWLTTRAEEAARQQAAEQARREAVAAWTELQERPEPELSARLGQALVARQAAQRRQTLTPNDPEATQALFDAAFAMGEVANQGELWALSREAFAAARIGVDDERVAAALTEVDRLESSEGQRRKEEIQSLLAEVRGGGLRRRPDAFLDAVFAIGRYPDAQTVELLTQALDEVTAQLEDLERAAYEAVAKPKRAENGEELNGLASALERRRQNTASAADSALLEKAETRMIARAERSAINHLRSGLAKQSYVEAVGRFQTENLKPGMADLARVACANLGHLGIAEGAVPALLQYLEVECSSERAAVAGKALVQLGESDQALALEERFGEHSTYSRTVLRTAGLVRLAIMQDGSGTPSEQRAEDLLAAGKAVDALAVVNHLLRLPDSDKASLYDLRARCLLELGDHEAVITACDAALGLEPRNVNALCLRGLTHSELRRWKKARADLQAILALDEGRVEAYLIRARMHSFHDRMRAAKKTIEHALQLAPEHPLAWLERARIAAANGELQLAMESANRAVQYDPANPAVLTARAWLEGSTSADDLRQALELDPNNGQALALKALNMMLHASKAEVLSVAKRAVELAPHSAEAHAVLGMAHAGVGNVKGAKDELRSAGKLKGWLSSTLRESVDLLLPMLDGKPVSKRLGSSVVSLSIQAPALLQAKEYRLAEEAARRLIKLDNSGQLLSHYRRMLAQAYEGQGRIEDALKTMDACMEAEGWRTALRRYRAQLRFKKRDHAGVIQDLEKILAVDATDPAVWAERGRSYLYSGQPKKALADLNQALRRAPKLAWALRLRAHAHLNLKQFAKAVADADASLKLEPNASGILWIRGLAKSERGDKAAGAKDLRRFLRLHPNAPAAKRVRKALKAWGMQAPPKKGRKQQDG